MKLVFAILLVTLSGFANSSPRSIKSEPLNLTISLEKKDYSLALRAYGHLKCFASSCPFGVCESKQVSLDLSPIQITQLGETSDSVSYAINYNDTQELRNPYGRKGECEATFVIEATDGRYRGPYREGSELNKGSQAWASFQTSQFKNLEELQNMHFKHYYSWERYTQGKVCFGTPRLCNKFLYVVPTVPLQKLQFESITGGTGAVFPEN